MPLLEYASSDEEEAPEPAAPEPPAAAPAEAAASAQASARAAAAQHSGHEEPVVAEEAPTERASAVSQPVDARRAEQSDVEDARQAQQEPVVAEEAPAERAFAVSQPVDSRRAEQSDVEEPHVAAASQERGPKEPPRGQPAKTLAHPGMPFSQVIDMFIAQQVAGGRDAPPAEYKAQIIDIYENAPPEGQEEMMRDMCDQVNNEAESEEEKDEEEDARQPDASDPQEEDARQPDASGPQAPPAAGPAERQERGGDRGGERGEEASTEGRPSEAPLEACKEPVPLAADVFRAAAEPTSAGGLRPSALLEAAKLQAQMAKKPNPLVFFEILIDEVTVGHIEFELFADIVPKTAENFRCLCTGEVERKEGQTPLCYLGSDFHRIIPGFMCQGGDFTKGNGTGGESIYGPKFDDENFKRKHTKGCLSMANSGPNTNGSQFFICLDAPSHLDGKHVVFGEVVAGYDVVQKMEACGSRSGRVAKKVAIKNCGMVNMEESQASKRQRLIDVAPAPRLASEDVADTPVQGGLLGLLAQADASVASAPDAAGAGPAHSAAVARGKQAVAEEVHIMHILRKHAGCLKPKTRGGAPITDTIQEAAEYLEEIANQLVGLGPEQLRKQFADLARTESHCASAKKGGDVGRFRRGQRQPAFEQAAFALDIGEVSDVVQTDSGVHLLLRVP